MNDFENDYWRSAPVIEDRLQPLEPAIIADDQFRLLADNIPTLCWIANGDGYIVWYNRRWHEYCGTTPEQMEGWGWQSVHDPELLPEVMERWTSSIATGQPFEMTFPLRGADGIFRPFLTRIQPVRDKSGQVVRWFGVNTEITAQVSAEQALRESENRLRRVLETDAIGVIFFNYDGYVVDANDAFIKMTGYTRAKIASGELHWRHMTPPEWIAASEEQMEKFAETGRLGPYEKEYICADGTRRWMLFAGRDLGDGTIAEYCVDISDRKHAEEAAHASETRYREVFQNAGVGMIEIDADWNILTSNQTYREITRREEEDLRGANCLSFTHPDDIALGEEALRGLAAGESNRAAFEKRYVTPDGNTVWVRSTLSRVSGHEGALRFLKIVEDVTEVRQAREALREESQNLEILNRTGAAVAAELDLEKVVQMVTDAGVELTGAEFGAFFYNVINDAGESYMLYTLSGAERSAFEKFPMPRNTAVFAPTFEGTGVVRSEDITKDPRYGKNKPNKGMPKGHLPVRSYLAVPVTGRTGEVLGGLFFGHSQPGCFTERHERLMTGIASQAAIAIDNARLYQALQQANATLEQRVDERTRELETANEALRQSQKMEAIGQLTGGIAHDFNNMLTVIRGSADILQRPGLIDSKRQRYLEAITETADRAARLTGQLLAFARRQALKPEVFDARERVESIADMLQTLLGSRIRLQISADCDKCFVEADASQFETALVNMAVNARDAMNEEGELSISVKRSDRLPRSLQHGEADGYVAVSVTDTGHGIAPEDQAKIFEPFFTTKEVGKGTGLGLSQVYGFAKQSGGEIEVSSRVGEGSTFTLYLPRAKAIDGAKQVDGKEAPRAQANAKVLVVEDNDDVGRFAEEVLFELGYEAVRAGTAAEALELLDNGHSFDVVFSDVVMPGKSGIELAQEIRARWPELPVVLTSGYSHILAAQTGHGFPLLQKPYSLDALGAALDKALHRQVL